MTLTDRLTRLAFHKRGDKFTFPESVREKCPGETTDGGFLPCIDGFIECGFEENHYAGGYCPHCGPNRGKGTKHSRCHGLGSVASQDLAVWFDALRKAEWRGFIGIEAARFDCCLWPPAPCKPADGFANTPLETIVSALELALGIKESEG